MRPGIGNPLDGFSVIGWVSVEVAVGVGLLGNISEVTSGDDCMGEGSSVPESIVGVWVAIPSAVGETSVALISGSN